MHPDHRPGWHARLRHFVLAFHDPTFEVVAKSYAFRLVEGPLDAHVGSMLALLRQRTPPAA